MIWLVDDDEEDLEFFNESLLRNGYKGQILFITKGATVLELLKQSSPDHMPSVMVLDLNMQTKSGFEVLAEIKSDARHRHIPVMILSGSADRNDRAKCLELGCHAYWEKPVTIHGYNAMANELMKFFR